MNLLNPLFGLSVLLLWYVPGIFTSAAALARGGGKAIYMDDDFVYAHPFTGFAGTSQATLEAWVRFGESSQEQSVISYAITGSDNELWWAGNRQQLCAFGVCGTYNRVGFDGAWHHFAIELDGTTGGVNIYLDGVLNQNHTYKLDATPYIFPDGGALALGQDQDGVLLTLGQSFRGYIDDVRVWKTKRTAKEISDNYRVSLTGTENGLISYWKFDNGYANSVSSGLTFKSGTPSTISATICGTDPLEAASVESTASICSDGSDSDSVAYEKLNPGEDLTFSLVCASTATSAVTSVTITALPSTGSLFQVDSSGGKGSQISLNDPVSHAEWKVIYSSADGTFADTSVSIKITPSSGTAVNTKVNLVKNNKPVLAASQTLTAKEDRGAIFKLTATDSDNEPLTTVIASLPSKGSLYQHSIGVPGAPIISGNTTVSDFSNAVMYIPPSDEFGSEYTTFEYYVIEKEPPFTKTSTSKVSVDVLTVNDVAVVSPTGYAALFDGVDDLVVSVDNSGGSSTYGKAIFSLWIYPTMSSVSGGEIIIKSSDFSCELSRLVNGTIPYQCTLIGGSTVSTEVSTEMKGISHNAWNHLSVVFEEKTISTYINGTLSSSNASSSSSITVSSISLAGDIQTGNHLEGYFDDVLLIDTSLMTSNEILSTIKSLSLTYTKQVVQSQLPSSSLILFWHFDAVGSQFCKSLKEAGAACSAGNGLSHRIPLNVVSTAGVLPLLRVDTVQNGSPVKIKLPVMDVDNATTTISVVSLPATGTLYQVDSNGGVGRPISLTQSSGERLEQYVSGVVRFSSQFTATRFSVSQVIGPPNALLDKELGTYDNTLTWAHSQGTNCKRSNESTAPDIFFSEYLEVEFEKSVFVEEVLIYEINTLGSIVRIKAWDRNQYHTLWTGEVWGGPSSSNREFLPHICQSTFKTNRIRLELDTCNSTGWNNYDAILLTGLTEMPLSTVESNSGEVFVQSFDSGEDSFSYLANDCPYHRSTRSKPVVAYINAKSEDNEFPVMYIIIISLVSSIILIVIVFLLLRRRVRNDHFKVNTAWILSPDDLTGRPKYHNDRIGSARSGNSKATSSSDSLSSLKDLSFISNHDPQKQFYKEVPVTSHVFSCPKEFKLSQDLIFEFNQLFYLPNMNNFSRLIGLAIVSKKEVALVGEYASRGTLEDILYGSRVKPIEAMKSSMINDLLNGILFLESTFLGAHGMLILEHV